MIKRFTDVLGSLFGLIVFAPIIFFVAIAVRMTLGAPIVFRQRRTGLHGSVFELYKFRTMLDDTTAGEPRSDEDRLTTFGTFLRHTSLDELPQFWNVLKGDMSLVGPRPLLPEYHQLYTTDQARRLEARPGLTSWVAVNGRNAVSWSQQFEMDVWYVDHQSLQLDLKILALTVVAVIRREGITQPSRATRDRFTGVERRELD